MLLRRHLPQNPPHNLPGTRFRKPRHHLNQIRLCNRPNHLVHHLMHLRLKRFQIRGRMLTNQIRVDPLPFDIMRIPHHRRLHNIRMLVNRILNLRRTQPMPRNIQHIIHPTGNPIIPVLIPPAPIPRKVVPLVRTHVRLQIPLMIPPHRPRHARPRMADAQIPAHPVPLDLIAIFIHQHGKNPWQRQRRKPRLRRRHPS